MNRVLQGAAGALFSALLCGSSMAQPGDSAGCRDCGTVESVHQYTRHGETSGGGAILGGIAGGVLGHQIGSGRGNTAMTVLGAAGGAYAGNEVEKRHKQHSAWQVSVRMDSGAVRTVSYRHAPDLRAGDRVRLSHGKIALLTRSSSG
jgi:outer membrane lipoprotein SlyB